ncbi:hypothetical protein OJ998_04965 [Solirubrobacter taibaiensis]|nr:hypothetical protein [Solirubrobacter taibaiensis]
MRKSARWLSFGAALGVALAVAAPATAGTYTVTGTCGNWAPSSNHWDTSVASAACPQLKLEHPLGPNAAPSGHEARWTFDAPNGTTITAFSGQFSLLGTNGWQASLHATGVGQIEGCPGSTCPGAYKFIPWSTYGAGSSGSIFLRFRCGPVTGCAMNPISGYAFVWGAHVVLTDWVAPGVTITGGQLASGTWQRSVGTVAYDAGDNIGIRLVRAYIDGRPRAEAPRTCDYSSKYPCPNGGGVLNVDTAGIPDGPHTLTVEAIDGANNAASTSTTVYADNTAPAPPRELSAEGGEAWRATSKVNVSWKNPPQAASPIVAADYAVCPAANAAGDPKGCVTRSATGTNIERIDGVEVPAAGDWKVWLFLRDAAGNVDASTIGQVPRLRYDPTPPSVSFLPVTPDDPTRIRVAAADATSGLATQSLEIRREGTDAWVPVPVTPDAQGFSAALDDGNLPEGTYHLRARVTDAAGNEKSAETAPDGAAATMAFPVRLKTRLAVGKVAKVRAKSSRSGKPRYRRVLVGRPRAPYGRTIKLNGRLTTPGANPVVDADVQVWELIDLPGAAWSQIATVRTSRTGRFAFKALRGPSRLVQFRYGGTAMVRSRTTTVDLRVRATTSMRVNRHRVMNGDYVTFRGRLMGRPIPAGGKLVELQVYSRRRWRTFGTARANETTGLWAYQYRFEAITGTIKFRFRARVRKEATYPFDLGTSRRVRVTVRGQ